MQIHTYAKQGNIKGVAKEIAKGVDIDCLDKDHSQTPLMCAVTSSNTDIDMIQCIQVGDVEKAKLILASGIN